MPQCVVIADDLTGANATGVLLKKMNYKAYTVMNTERIELSTLTDCDCVLYPTDSRGVEPTIAYNRVHNVCNLLKGKDVKVYSKRIDGCHAGLSGGGICGYRCALLSILRQSRNRRIYAGQWDAAS